MQKRLFTLLPFLIGALFIVAYALFPTKMHYVDGLAWAYNIENFPLAYEFNQHHPIWLPMMHILFQAVKTLLSDLRSLAFLSFTNAVLGGISVTLLIVLVRRICSNKLAPILAGLFFGVSWGMINFSTGANIYITIIVLLLAAMLVILGGEKLTRKRAILAAILMIIASLMHQITFFFTFVVLTAIWIRSPKHERIYTMLMGIALYAAVVVPVNYLIYLHSMSIIEGEFEMTFLKWLTAYAGEECWWTVIFHGFLYSEAAFAYTQFNAFMHIPGSELLFVVKPFGKTLLNPFFVIFYAIVILTSLWELKCVLKEKEKESKVHQVRVLLLVWFFIYFIFNQLFCSFELHYKLFTMPPLLALWTLRITELPQKYKIPIGFASCILVIFLATWNITTGLIPNTKPENNEFFKPVLEMATLVEKGDVLIFAREEFYPAWLARYYTDADVEIQRSKFNKFAITDKSLTEIEDQTIEFINNRYNHIYLTEKAFEVSNESDIWYFSGLSFPPPHPWLLAIYISSIRKTGEVESDNGLILHEVILQN